MKVCAEGSGILGEPIHELVGYEGILGVTADPALPSEDKLREMAAEDSAGLAMTLRKLSYLESVARGHRRRMSSLRSKKPGPRSRRGR